MAVLKVSLLRKRLSGERYAIHEFTKILRNYRSRKNELLENIKTMEYVKTVSWSEMVEVIGDNNSEVICAFFANN